MATEPDVLSLRIVCPPPGQGAVEVRPIVSGRDLLADVFPRGTGVSPRYLLTPDGLLHATATPREIRLAGAGCGEEWCCGALYATVRREGEHVVWAGWHDPADQGVDLPELRFAADQYEDEVHRAEEDRRWEWPAGAVARMLEARLRGHEAWLSGWKCELEGVWASRTEPDRIHVVLIHPCIRAEADRPWLQFGMTLPISADVDAAEQAERLEARLTAGDPRATAEVWGGSHDAERLGYPWPPVHPSGT
ncbi:hypothetical protein ACFVZW_07035 [Streptomyces sp. NPDC059567]|uniref:hypothetical protein n=1 Tax=Streptomyces sp. NPDC059567 TaxID=3346867 RepID=UPI0036B6FF22